jgi:hypothetical protein
VQRTIECFYPGSSFPAISVTGTSCALNCKHCGRKYLEGMVPANTPDDLLGIAEALAERGANGFLLSGGADRSGKVKLASYCEAVREIKATTDLKINAHIGLVSRTEIRKLVGSGIDAFSVDVYGSDDTIREVLGIDARVHDYFRVVEGLQTEGALVAPHVCIGIHGGELRGEFEAIERLAHHSPKALILISLIPTKGTAFQDVRPPDKGMVTSVVKRAREALPETRILMGCMRSKRDRSWEPDLVAAGLDGIVLPSPKTVAFLRANGYSVKKRAVCCSMV